MAISAHEKAGQWSHALSLLNQLTDACVTPDVVTFNAAVSACHKGGAKHMKKTQPLLKFLHRRHEPPEKE